ncbi:phosphopantothenate/pantothenate synthetase [Methanobrevibacter sp. DSM 116169]|uniref:phosphopantothenate/pantothenate synthetase n=1 Tax=Methanobrevibacter sp. DSM 116169 TaxID=3242727 RepID=UPI0038FD200E
MINKNHPRYESLLLREKIKNAYKEGYLAETAMIAHGRGEAFDYLLGEQTSYPAKRAIYAAVSLLLLSKNPVISVNGNTVALAIDDIIDLANTLNAKIEINLFYRSDERVDKIAELFKSKGFTEILGTNDDDIKYINSIENPRASASSSGIYSADVVLIPLEDGDRAELLSKTDKKTITIDLNPLSRTSMKSNISIVDNIIRAIPFMNKIAKDLKVQNISVLKDILIDYSNEDNLKDSIGSFKIKEEK